MNRSSLHSILRKAWVPIALTTILAVPAAAEYTETRNFSSESLTVRNMVGQINVEAGGSEFEVEVRVMGKDASKGALVLDSTDDVLNIKFPGGQTDFVYPKLGRGSNTNFDRESGNWASDVINGMLGRNKISISGSGPGMELWADVTIRMPSGTSLRIEHGVGTLVAESVDGNLELSTRSGDVEIDGTSGELAVATGSGDVTLMRISGTEAQVATGSGDVEADGFDGDEMQIATGSGDVTVLEVRGRSVQIATGSGDIEASALDLEEVEIGTGSGDVQLALDHMGPGDFSVGTGSGDIKLVLPNGASAEVHAETRGGRISVTLGSEVQYHKRDPDEIEMTVGTGGARVSLGSGNGNISIAD